MILSDNSTDVTQLPYQIYFLYSIYTLYFFFFLELIYLVCFHKLGLQKCLRKEQALKNGMFLKTF